MATNNRKEDEQELNHLEDLVDDELNAASTQEVGKSLSALDNLYARCLKIADTNYPFIDTKTGQVIRVRGQDGNTIFDPSLNLNAINTLLKIQTRRDILLGLTRPQKNKKPPNTDDTVQYYIPEKDSEENGEPDNHAE